MTISFDASLLTSYYNAKAGIPASSASGSSGSNAFTGATGTKSSSPTGSDAAPSAPWSGMSSMPQESDLVTKVLQGQRFINSNAVISDVNGASPDYTKLFTLYQGLNALEGLASAANAKNVSANQLADIQRRFTAGMTEVGGYVASTKYDHVALTEGTLTQDLKNTVGAARTDTTYNGPMVATGSASTAVKAFEGDVAFTVTAQKTGTKTPITVNLDLSDMGLIVRSMSNVVSYINGKLKDAGLSTKFAVNRTPAVPQTITVGGKSVTVSQGQDTFGLQIKGVSTEQLTMSAASTADSVYVVQTTGDPTKKITTTSSASTKTPAPTTDVTSQLIKFQTDTSSSATPPDAQISKPGDSYWVPGEAEQTALPGTVATVATSSTGVKSLTPAPLATAAAPDGSVYVLANVNGTTDGQDIKGTQDVALSKYDSAGNLVYTRTLGASDTATGYAITVSNDGKVAIAGSVTGALDVSKTTTTTIGTGAHAISSVSTANESVNGADSTTTDSFVTVFDSSGVEQWTQRRGSTGADQATSVAFGDDGSVYVGGKTQATMPGASGSSGGWDGYIMAFDSTGKAEFTTQTGTAQSDATSGLVVSGSTLYASSIENGDVVLRSYSLSSTPVTTTDAKGVSTTTTKYAATPTATRNLGGIGGGEISGMSVYNGKVYLGGSSGSDRLLRTTADVTLDYSSSYDAFALSVDANLSTTTNDKIAYYGGSGIENNAKVQFSNGKAWISGQTTGDIDGTTKLGKNDAYLARLNIDTGQVEYSTRYTGTDGAVTPNAIAISHNSSSALDKLGLPMGQILQTDSNTITSNSSVRTGDQFYMVDPSTGVKQTITIDAGETMASLAKKIVRASNYKLTADVSKVLNKEQDQLNIKPTNGSSSMEFVAGPAGRDALSGLGLPSGVVSNDAGKTIDSSLSNYTKTQKDMGLSFDTSLNLNSAQNITNAIAALQATIKNVQKVYSYLKYGDPQASKSKTGNNSGTVPTYLTNQIANYTAGLNRLTNGG